MIVCGYCFTFEGFCSKNMQFCTIKVRNETHFIAFKKYVADRQPVKEA